MDKVIIIMMVNEVFDVQWCYDHGDVKDAGGDCAIGMEVVTTLWHQWYKNGAVIIAMVVAM